MSDDVHLLDVVLEDWVRRVVRKCEQKGIHPIPWQTARALKWCLSMRYKLAGESPYGLDPKGDVG